MGKRPEALFVASLIGNQVKTEKGESLGKIEDLVIDPFSGQIKSVVLSLGDASGLSSGLSAIPWGSLKLSQTDSNRSNVNRNGSGSKNDSRANKAEPKNDISVYTCPVYRSR